MHPINSQLKDAVKEALLELMQEHREEFQTWLFEAVEDVALTHAIEEGLKTPSVGRGEMLDWLSQRQ